MKLKAKKLKSKDAVNWVNNILFNKSHSEWIKIDSLCLSCYNLEKRRKHKYIDVELS